MRTLAFRRWLLGSLAALLLAGCGQKGPLYLPEDEQQEEEQQTSVESNLPDAHTG